MPLSDLYEIDSGLITVSGTAQVPVLVISAVVPFFAAGIRVMTGSTAAPAGSSSLFIAGTVSNVPSGGTPVTPRALNGGPASSLTAAAAPFSTAPVLGKILWDMELPQASGSSWEEFPPSGFEWGVPVSGFLACFVVNSAADGTPVQFQIMASQ